MNTKVGNALDTIESEFEVLESKNEKLETENDFLKEERENVNKEDLFLSKSEQLYWKCNNLAVTTMMETLMEKLKQHGPLKIETLLNTLP